MEMFCEATVERFASDSPALISTRRGGAIPKLAWKREMFCDEPRSMTIVAGAGVAGCQLVAFDPSIAKRRERIVNIRRSIERKRIKDAPLNPYCPAMIGLDGPTSLKRVSLLDETKSTHSARLPEIKFFPLLLPVGTMRDSPTLRVLR